MSGAWVEYANHLQRETPRQTWLEISQWMFGLLAGWCTVFVAW